MVILLEISLKNIGLLQSFCYLNVKHPKLLCDAVFHMRGMSLQFSLYLAPNAQLATRPASKSLNDSCRHARREVLR